MPIQCRQRPPRGTSRCQLDDAGGEHESEQQPAYEEEEEGRGRRQGGRRDGISDYDIRREPDGEEASFQQQNVPLKPQKRLSDLIQGKVENPKQGEYAFGTAQATRDAGEMGEKNATEAKEIHAGGRIEA